MIASSSIMYCIAVLSLLLLTFPLFEIVNASADTHHDFPKFHKRQSTPFSEDQRINVDGDFAWKAPGPKDLRGPCPGLNALANHGYFPRNGVVGTLQAAFVVQQIYGITIDFSTVLTVYATLMDGDPLMQTFSIGKSPPPLLRLPLSLLGPGDGLSGSHNKFEADASATRGDYYLTGGDVSSLQVPTFKALYDLARNDPISNYDFGVITKHRKFTLEKSIQTNPNFFFPPFTGLLVSNAAHAFIPRLFSNHSTQYPDGILDKETLKTFFAITETANGQLTYRPGYERIPNNWYRRPLGALGEYKPSDFFSDLLAMSETIPGVIAIGGNTGKVNSFAGVNLADITGGAYNAQDLRDPRKLGCFFIQLTMAVVPDFLRTRLVGQTLSAALDLLQTRLGPLADPKCPKITNLNRRWAASFPGARLP